MQNYESGVDTEHKSSHTLYLFLETALQSGKVKKATYHPLVTFFILRARLLSTEFKSLPKSHPSISNPTCGPSDSLPFLGSPAL